jgi:hypothetical protein
LHESLHAGPHAKWAPLIFSQEGHDLKLRDAGAVHLAHSWSDVERFALCFFNG